MNDRPFDLGLAIAALNEAADLYKLAGKTYQSTTCADIAGKLDRFGSFASDKQRNYARMLVIEARGFRHLMTPGATPVEAAAAMEPVQAPAPAGKVPAGTFPVTAAMFGPSKLAHIEVGSVHLKTDYDFNRIFVMFNDVCLATMSPKTGTTYTTKRAATTDPQTIAEMMAALALIEADPVAAMRAHGTATGRCSACARHLTDPDSIAFGIGPICRGKMGL